MIPMIFMSINSEDDRSKLLQIWERYYSLMMYEAKKYLDDSIAEDAASESFIKIIHNLDKFQDITSNRTRAYVVTIVRNTSKIF